jgi:hypothetical protein
MKALLKQALICLMALSCAKQAEVQGLNSISYSNVPSSPQSKSFGVEIPYSKIPKDKAYLVHCSYYDVDMQMLTRLDGHFCKPIEVTTDNKKQIFHLAIFNSALSFYNNEGELLWRIEGSYNHDIAYDDSKRLLFAIEDYSKTINDQSYDYFRIKVLNLEGKVIREWNSDEHINTLSKISLWERDENNVDHPISARMNKRKLVFNANFLEVLEKDWRHLKKGTLIVHVRYLNSLLAFDDQFNLIWHYTFDKNPRKRVHYDIHTPIFLEDGSIIAFNNQIYLDEKMRAGVSHFFVDSNNIEDTFLIPVDFKNQQNIQTFGSIQRLNDNSLIISTGSEYGGIIHLTKDSEVLFKWFNPQRDQESNIPVPIYRASLIPASWVPTKSK